MADTEYHYLITMAWNPNGRDGVTTRYTDGTVTAPTTVTRQELVKEIIRSTKQLLGSGDDAVVMFLSIEPNRPPAM